MVPLIPSGNGPKGLIIRLSVFLLIFAFSAAAQTGSSPSCSTTATNQTVRQEGLTEPLGAIVLNCSGTPGSSLSTNITVSLNAAVTNRTTGAGTALNLFATVNTGAGAVPSGMATLVLPNAVAFNNVSLTVPASGTFSIQIAGLRASVTQFVSSSNPLAIAPNITASLSTNLALNNPNLVVGSVQRGLLATYSSNGITCVGSPVPSTVNIANLFTTGTNFVSTRITEGFGGAFLPKDASSDTGTRIVISYSGFPSGSQVFVPDLVAGNDTVQPTAGGDIGEVQSGGIYAPTANGSLLLARVLGADANGAGGSPLTVKASIAGLVALSGASAVTLTNGSGIAVYEVIDSNPSLLESAQFPTFLGLNAAPNATPVVASDAVSFGPISTVTAATATDPIPRFANLPPPSDCQANGDCGASYFPALTVDTTSLQFTGQAGGTFQTQYVRVNNKGGGLLLFTASLTFQSGSGWLTASPNSGVNDATIRLDAAPGNLGAGVYNATLTINAGSAGTRTVPVTYTLTAPAPPPVAVITVSSITNAATLQPGPLVAGSLATIKGQNFGTTATVTFDGIPAQILYDSATQINLQVPSAVASPKTSSQVVVTVNGMASAAQTVLLAGVAPGVFGTLNQDGSVNTAATPTHAGQVVQVFATGLISAASGPVTAILSGTSIPALIYSGPAPGLTGVQQVNFAIPPAQSAGPASLILCAANGPQPVCSPASTLAVQ